MSALTSYRTLLRTVGPAYIAVAFLGRIPLDIEIRCESDAGNPPAAGEGPHAHAFADLARTVAGWLEGKALR